MFKEYESKPVKRLAHQITANDDLVYQGETTATIHTPEGTVSFKYHEKPELNGWVVYLNKSDVYYCSDEVFRERNIVP